MKTFKSFLLEIQSLFGEDGDVIEHNGGIIDIYKSPKFSPRSQSIVNFVVPEEKRNSGIGHILVKKAMEKYKDLGAQVSSPESLKVFHNNGFRNPNLPNENFENHLKEFHKNGGSLFVAVNDKNGNPYVN